MGYFRYVDDILILHKETTTNIHEILDKFNNISPTLTFTMETENDSIINFSDITIQKKDHKLDIGRSVYHFLQYIYIPRYTLLQH